ncbi:MAG: immunoglobulin domain-containing protein [Verrucomicrobia bacterium]|nr:immunoglobulin domain-containing protein [Verrucomicrobiota bacterium]
MKISMRISLVFLALSLSISAARGQSGPTIQLTSGIRPKSVHLGENVSFTVSAAGVEPLSFQWRLDGKDLAGETNSTLTITGAERDDEGDYTVEVRNPEGRTISPPSRLWIVPPSSDIRQSDFVNSTGVRMPYFYHLPERYDPGRRYPLVLHLHHAGLYEAAVLDWFGNKPGIIRYISYRQQKTDPAILVLPTHEQNVGWTDADVSALSELLDRLLSEFRIDPDRIYLSATSIGGGPLMQLLAKRPNLFAGAAIRSAVANIPKAEVPLMKHVPVWGFESATEGSYTRTFIADLRAAGGRALLTVYNSGTHSEAVTAANSAPHIDWLFSQRRGQVTLPSLAITGRTLETTYRTGADFLDLRGSAQGFAYPVSKVSWLNLALNRRGDAIGTEAWSAPGIPLAANRTNAIVVTATLNLTWVPVEGTTTFNDTVSVFSSPLQATLALQGNQLILNWTGGVPPFRLQRSSDLGVPAWTEMGNDLTPPLTLPKPAGIEFFRVVGQ